jgi:hypothetical protein
LIEPDRKANDLWLLLCFAVPFFPASPRCNATDRGILLNSVDEEIDANSLVEFIFKGNPKTLPITPDMPRSPYSLKIWISGEANVWYGFENY